LSPLGEKVDSRDLIVALGATPVIVAPNRLGVVNDLRLTLAALPSATRQQALVVLMDPETPDAATRGNAGLLGEYFDHERMIHFPWLRQTVDLARALQVRRVREAVAKLTLHLLPSAGASARPGV
jgi:dethiobiotin synthetase